jgi:hypothetical protein
MPQTVELKVLAHELAEDRVKRGLPRWKGTLTFLTSIGQLVKRHEEGDPTLTAQMMLDGFHAAAKEVREKVPEAKGDIIHMKDDDLEAFLLTLEEWTLSFIENCPDIIDEFDDVLDRLYDWCDVNRWWIEPAGMANRAAR